MKSKIKKKENLVLALYFALLTGYAHESTIAYWKQSHNWPVHFSWQLVSLFMVAFFTFFFMAGLFSQTLIIRLLSLGSLSSIILISGSYFNLSTVLFWFFHCLICVMPIATQNLFFLFLNYLTNSTEKMKIYFLGCLGSCAIYVIITGTNDINWLYAIVVFSIFYLYQEIDLSRKVF